MITEGAVKIIDHLDEFERYLSLSTKAQIEEKLPLFNELVFSQNAQFYSCIPGMLPDGIKAALPVVEANFDQVKANQNEIITRFNNVLSKFRKSFPLFKLDFEVHLMISLGFFNGMALPRDGKCYLLLGMDSLSGLSENHLKGYITHELFHIYHYQRNPEVARITEIAMRTMKMPDLWGLLFTEGLACHAVQRIFPEIPEVEILAWQPLLAQSKPVLPLLATEARAVLTSDDPKDIAGFFYFPNPGKPDLPTGCGYYLGMLVAGIMAEKYPIDVLLKMPDEVLIREIDFSLQQLQK